MEVDYQGHSMQRSNTVHTAGTGPLDLGKSALGSNSKMKIVRLPSSTYVETTETLRLKSLKREISGEMRIWSTGVLFRRTEQLTPF